MGATSWCSGAYETLFCNPLLSTAWPEELRVVIRRCLSSRPAERPTAVQILGSCRSSRHASMQLLDAARAGSYDAMRACRRSRGDLGK